LAGSDDAVVTGWVKMPVTRPPASFPTNVYPRRVHPDSEKSDGEDEPFVRNTATNMSPSASPVGLSRTIVAPDTTDAYVVAVPTN
jgi:hypothetical protein